MLGYGEVSAETEPVLEPVNLDSLHDEMAVLNAEKIYLQGELRQSEDERRRLHSKVEHMSVEIDNLHFNLRRAGEEHEKLRNTITRLDQSLEEYRERDVGHGQQERDNLRSKVAQLQGLLTAQDAKVKTLTAERDQYFSDATHLHAHERRMKLEPRRARNVPPQLRNDDLDVFDNTLDQVSEADVVSNGNASVERLNHSINDFVNHIIETAQTIGIPRTEPASTELALTFIGQPLLRITASLCGCDDNAPLLLDAALHDRILSDLWDTFFLSPVTTFPTASTPGLEAAFEQMKQKGTRLDFMNECVHC